MTAALPSSPFALSLADPANLAAMLNQAEQELNQLEPAMAQLEQEIQEHQQRLDDLRQNKRKLMTLRLSLQAMLSPGSLPEIKMESVAMLPDLPPVNASRPLGLVKVPAPSAVKSATPNASPEIPDGFEGQAFLPDRAFEQADCLLKQRNSLNYELFRAIVFSGGIATTEQIKQYLVAQGIQQPNTGGTFTSVELSDISARVGYLIRKGLVQAMGKGYFISKLGWESPSPVIPAEAGIQ